MSDSILKFKGEVLLSSEEIEGHVSRIAEEINALYRDIEKPLVVICLLRGSFIFTADLVRKLDVPLVTEFMSVSSYGSGTTSSADVRIQQDLDISITDRDVLLVEDIVDTGRTFQKVLHLLESREPRSLRSCALLDKPDRRVVPISADISGVKIPDAFVVGYGLDYAGLFRELPFVGILDPSVYGG